MEHLAEAWQRNPGQRCRILKKFKKKIKKKCPRVAFMKPHNKEERNKVIMDILKSIEGTGTEALDTLSVHHNQNCLPPGGRDSHNQNKIGILVAKKRKIGDTPLTRKVEQ